MLAAKRMSLDGRNIKQLTFTKGLFPRGGESLLFLI